MTGLGHGLRPDRRAMVGADAGTSVPGISVVIPTYQRAHVIGEAIASVLRQTHSHFELLVVDDGSTDETAAVVSSFKDERLKLVSIDHGGRSRARNEGAARARGASVVFLDSDDQAEPNWLEKLYLAFDNPAVAVVCCGAHVTTDRPQLKIHSEEIVMPRRLGPAHSNRIGLFRAGTFVVKRGVFAAIGGYDPRLAYSENSELAVRLIRYCEAHALSLAAVYEPLVRIGRRRGFPAQVECLERLEAAELMLSRHGGRHWWPGSPSFANQHAVAGANAYRLGLAGRAIRHFASAAVADPWRPVHWGRLSLALMPPLARRFWTRQSGPSVSSDSDRESNHNATRCLRHHVQSGPSVAEDSAARVGSDEASRPCSRRGQRVVEGY